MAKQGLLAELSHLPPIQEESFAVEMQMAFPCAGRPPEGAFSEQL